MFDMVFNPEWSTLKKLIWLKATLLSGAAAIIKTVTGTAPLTLTNAISHAIVSLTQYGKCVQDGSPTPSDPVDIYCNNGKLMMVDNELPSGYKRVLGFRCNNNAMWQITGFKLRGSDTVKVSFSVTAACNVWGCYQSTDATDNYDLYATTTNGGKYLRYANGTYASYFSSENQGKRFDVTYTPTGTQGMPEDSTWTEASFESANDLLLGSTTIGGTSSKLKGNLYGDFIVENGGVERLHIVPCERVSDNVLGYYDLVGEAFYEPYEGYTGAVSLGYDGSHYGLDVVGTPETLTITADGAETQTVNDVSNLLAVGNYADTEELIHGIKTGKIGVMVFDGTENFYVSTGDTYGVAIDKTKYPNSYVDAVPVLCTHLPFSTSSSTSQTDVICNRSGNYGIRLLFNATIMALADTKVAAAKAFFASEYAKGTPVMVIYVKTTETTEQTTAHALATAEGTNVVDVTSNVDPVTLKAEYKGTE